MPHYKDKNNKVHFLESAEHEHLLPAGCVKITDAEADAIQNPPLTIEEVRANKLAALAAYRYVQETAGIVVGGATIKTDRESQAMISGAKLYADLNLAALIDWKGADGWVQIDRTTLLAIGQAVGAHVQACFSNERVHAEAIAALTTVAEIEAYDFTTGWSVK
jgi:hypothetical protein